MRYEQMHCFLEVAGVLSFTAAAKNLYMSQQAVTKQIASLEQELGFPLFTRSTRSVELTEAGRQLRDDFTVIERQMNASVRKARNLAGIPGPRATVGFLSLLNQQSVIVPVCRRLFAAFPEVRFDLKLLDFADLRNQLLDRRLDFCITTSYDWALWPNVKVDVLESKPFEIVFSCAHPLASLDPFDPEALKDYTHFILPRDSLLPGVEEWAQKLPCRDSVPCPDLATMRVWLETGVGFALLTRVFEGSQSETLTYRPAPFEEACADLVCIRRADMHPELNQMVQCVRDCFRKI